MKGKLNMSTMKAITRTVLTRFFCITAMLAALMSVQAEVCLSSDYSTVGGSTTWSTAHTNNFNMVISGTLNNSSSLTNDYLNILTVNSTGALKNNSGGTLNIAAVTWLDHYGILTNASGATLNNAGQTFLYPNSTLSNAGTVNNDSYMELQSGGALTNSSILNNTSALDNTGALTNALAATLNNTGSGSVTVWNGGTFTNAGVVQNDAMMFNAGGNVINSGTINSTLTLVTYGTLTNTGAITNSGYFSNSATMTNSGAGTYTQSAGHTINDATITTATPLAINGGILSGYGTVIGAVTIAAGADVMPGDSSVGTLTLGALTSSGNYHFELGGVATPLFDQLIVNGAATFAAGTVTFDFVNDFSAKKGDHWDFLAADSLSGFNNLTFGVTGLDSGYWKIDTNGGVATLSITGPDVPVTTPEPSTYLLMLISFACLAAVKGKMGKKSLLAASP